MTLFAFVFALAIVAALLVPAYMINGFVLFKLWGWFFIPLGLPEISFIHAIGVGIIVSFLTSQHIPENKDEEKYKPLVTLYVQPIIILLIGWIVSLLM